MSTRSITFRASAPHATRAKQLGPLADLPGTWVGSGFNLISLPDKHDIKHFRLKLNATRETLQFTPIGGEVPNRGSAQDDIFIFGVTYLQRVHDAQANSALHIEPGLWLHVPARTEPPANATVVRQGTIPHGNSLLAQGDVLPTVAGGPTIDAVDSTPTQNPFVAPLDGSYLDPFFTTPLPPGLPAGINPQELIKNPNLLLTQAIQGQTITNTVVLKVSTPPNGIVNIPFVVNNANATQLDATFFIETVEQPDGSGEFMQLQYTQKVILNFSGIDWPHISVATLVKQ
jgi:hypothetical protein